jgi:hypothetical protein
VLDSGCQWGRRTDDALTGEALETEVADGGRVRSGVVNAGSMFERRAAPTAE